MNCFEAESLFFAGKLCKLGKNLCPVLRLDFTSDGVGVVVGVIRELMT